MIAANRRGGSVTGSVLVAASPHVSPANEGQRVWSPGFSRSDAVSPWISGYFEPPPWGSTLPAKAGTPYAAPGPSLLPHHALTGSLKKCQGWSPWCALGQTSGASVTYGKPVVAAGETHGRPAGHSPWMTLTLPGVPPISAGPRNTRQAYGKPAKGGFSGFGPSWKVG